MECGCWLGGEASPSAKSDIPSYNVKHGFLLAETGVDRGGLNVFQVVLEPCTDSCPRDRDEATFPPRGCLLCHLIFFLFFVCPALSVTFVVTCWKLVPMAGQKKERAFHVMKL